LKRHSKLLFVNFFNFENPYFNITSGVTLVVAGGFPDLCETHPSTVSYYDGKLDTSRAADEGGSIVNRIG